MAREPLTSTQSPGPQHAAERGEPALDGRRPAGGRHAARALQVAARERPDRHEHVHARARGRRADLAVVGGRAGAELGHVAENGHLAALAGPLAQMLERGRHRERVRVVGSR